jgi:hypothetical protein
LSIDSVVLPMGLDWRVHTIPPFSGRNHQLEAVRFAEANQAESIAVKQ